MSEQIENNDFDDNLEDDDDLASSLVEPQIVRQEVEAKLKQINKNEFNQRRIIFDLYKKDAHEAYNLKSFKQFAENILKQYISVAHVYRLINAAKIEENLFGEGKICKIPEGTLRPLTKLSEENQRKVFSLAKASIEDSEEPINLDGKLIKQIIQDEGLLPNTNQTQNNKSKNLTIKLDVDIDKVNPDQTTKNLLGTVKKRYPTSDQIEQLQVLVYSIKTYLDELREQSDILLDPDDPDDLDDLDEEIPDTDEEIT